MTNLNKAISEGREKLYRELPPGKFEWHTGLSAQRVVADFLSSYTNTLLSALQKDLEEQVYAGYYQGQRDGSKVEGTLMAKFLRYDDAITLLEEQIKSLK